MESVGEWELVGGFSWGARRGEDLEWLMSSEMEADLRSQNRSGTIDPGASGVDAHPRCIMDGKHKGTKRTPRPSLRCDER
jgi:hypothetical protein